ncbi:MAG TPA: hypothetical protein VGB17_02900 [Pyrinomonadaceae bacterium]|jgi:archaellum component FlaC
MGEDTTQDISDKYDTKPTIETVLERITALADQMQKGFERIETRMDRIESEVKIVHSEMLTLRADFRELRSQLKEPA